MEMENIPGIPQKHGSLEWETINNGIQHGIEKKN
jgi:hypothetical protein